LQFIIRAKDEASKQLKGVDISLGGIMETALGFSLANIGGMVAGEFRDMVSAGIELEQTRLVFDRLAESVDEDSEDMLASMKEASMGMVDEAGLMASASKLVSMGLADNSEEAAKLTKMAVTLGAAMGKGPTQAMEEFALMLANQSIPRLDTFGISAGKVRTRINELREANKSLTREQAFMTAVMEEGTTSLERVGDISDTTAAKTAKIGVAVKEAKDAVGKLLVEAMDPLAEKLLEYIEITERTAEEHRTLAETAYEVSDSAEEFIKSYVALEDATWQAAYAQAGFGQAVIDNRLKQMYLKMAMDDTREMAKELTEGFTYLDHGMKMTAETAEDTGASIEGLKEDYEEWIGLLGRLKEAIREEMFPDESELREMGDILYQIYVEENPRVIAARQAHEAERISSDESLGIAQGHADELKALWEDAQRRLEETRAGMHGIPGAYDVQAITSEATAMYKSEWQKAQEEVEAMEEAHMATMAQLEGGIVGAVNAATSPALEVYRTYLANVEEAERLAAIGRSEAWIESIGGVAPDTADILAEMVRDGEIILDQIPEGIREDVGESLLEFEAMALGFDDQIGVMVLGSEEFQEVLTGAVTQGASAADVQGMKMKKSLVDNALEPAIDTSEDLRKELDRLDGTKVDIYIDYWHRHHGEPGPGAEDLGDQEDLPP